MTVRNTFSHSFRCSAVVLVTVAVVMVNLLGVSAVGVARADTVDERIDEATRMLVLYKFDQASGRFERLLGDVTPSETDRWERVNWGLAVCAQCVRPSSADLIERARRHYQAIADSDSTSLIAARATLQLGRLAEQVNFPGDQADVEAARTWYERVTQRWPDDPIAHEAATRLAGSWMSSADVQEVRHGFDYLLDWLEQHPGNSYASLMHQTLGQVALQILQDPERGVHHYTRAVELGLSNPVSLGMIAWTIARVADRQIDQIDTAVKYYQLVITDASKSGFGYDAKLRLEQLQAQYPERNIKVPELIVDFGQADQPDQAGQSEQAQPRDGAGGVSP